MKYIKTYEENIKNKPQVGDYAVVNYKYMENKEFEQYINTSVGKIVDFEENSISFWQNDVFKVKFDIPPDKKQWYNNKYIIISFSPDDIKYSSKNKENC